MKLNLIWWSKYDNLNRDLCVEWISWGKKEIMTVRGAGSTWRRIPSCSRILGLTIMGILSDADKAIDWGYHDDKERKNTHKPEQRECQKAE